MQEFSPELYPNLCALDDKVRKLLSSKEASKWTALEKEEKICAIHPIYWMEEYGFIKSSGFSDDSSEIGIIPFKLNPIQLYIADKICKHLVMDMWERVQVIILKHRKAGISTLCAGFDYWFMRTIKNLNAFAIADLSSHTDNIGEMISLFHQRDVLNPPERVPIKGAKKGMKLSNGSSVEYDSGENANPGTSGTLQICHQCIDPDTLVVCRDGFLVPANRTLGKKLMAHNIRPGKVVNIHKADSQEGYALDLAGSPFPLLTTKDHRLFAREGRGGSWVAVEDMTKHRPSHYKHWYVGYPIRSFQSYNDTRRLDKNIKTKTRKHGGGITHDNLSNYFPLTEEMGRVVGLYLAEGSIQMALKKYPATICLSCHQKELEKFKKVCESAGLKCSGRRLNGNRATVNINSSYWARVFKRLFGKCDKKRIPDWVWSSNPSFMRGIVWGYLTGDGHFCKDGISIVISSIRAQLLIQLREILLTLGCGYSNLKYRPAGNYYNRNCRAIWTLSILGVTGEAVRNMMGITSRKACNRHFWRMYNKIEHKRIWVRVKKIEPAWIENPIDLEIDHPVHSYIVSGCASHNSENAKWRDALTSETSLLNSMPRKGFVFIIKESTAFGLNKFAQDCELAEKGKSNWEFIFASWKHDPECEYPVHPEELMDYTEEEQQLITMYELRPGHIKFRRSQIELLGSVQQFKQDFPLNSREPFLTSGSNYFDITKIQERIDEIKFFRDYKSHGWDFVCTKYPDWASKLSHNNKGTREALSNIEFRNTLEQTVVISANNKNVVYEVSPNAKREAGSAVMYRAPIKDKRYIVVIDVAEGIKTSEYTSDNSIVRVIDVDRKEEVLEWGGVFDEEMTANYAVRIALLYNKADIVPEMNNKCGGALEANLKILGYRNIFHRETILAQKINREFGWKTTRGNKNDVCSQLKQDFKNDVCTIHNLDLLEEMLFFVDAGGKLCSVDGHNDDRIMTMSIGLKVIASTPTYQMRKSKAVFGSTTNLQPNTRSKVEDVVKKHNKDVMKKYM